MQNIIEQLIERADAHQAADEYKKGHYEWNGDGACAVGCAIKDLIDIGALPPDTKRSDHAAIAEATNTDPRIWHLQDRIFESLDNPSAWPPRFLRAVSQCEDTHAAVWRFLAWLLGPESPSAEGNANPEVSDEVGHVRSLCGRAAVGDMPNGAAWSSAEEAARSASGSSAGSASARLSARLAGSAAGSAAVGSAVEAATWSARSSVGSAWSAIADRLIVELERP